MGSPFQPPVIQPQIYIYIGTRLQRNRHPTDLCCLHRKIHVYSSYFVVATFYDAQTARAYIIHFLHVRCKREDIVETLFIALPDTSIARVSGFIYAVHTQFRPPRFPFHAVLVQQDYGSDTDILDAKCRLGDTIMADIKYTDDKSQNSYVTDV